MSAHSMVLITECIIILSIVLMVGLHLKSHMCARRMFRAQHELKYNYLTPEDFMYESMIRYMQAMAAVLYAIVVSTVTKHNVLQLMAPLLYNDCSWWP